MSIKFVKDSAGVVEPQSVDEAAIEEELKFIKENSEMSNQEIADELGISKWSVQRRRRTLKVRTAQLEEQREETLTQLAELLDKRETTKDQLADLDEQIDKLAQNLLGGAGAST